MSLIWIHNPDCEKRMAESKIEQNMNSLDRHVILHGTTNVRLECIREKIANYSCFSLKRPYTTYRAGGGHQHFCK